MDFLEASNSILSGQICDTEKNKLKTGKDDVKKVMNNLSRDVKLTLVLAMEEHMVVLICCLETNFFEFEKKVEAPPEIILRYKWLSNLGETGINWMKNSMSFYYDNSWVTLRNKGDSLNGAKRGYEMLCSSSSDLGKAVEEMTRLKQGDVDHNLKQGCKRSCNPGQLSKQNQSGVQGEQRSVKDEDKHENFMGLRDCQIQLKKLLKERERYEAAELLKHNSFKYGNKSNIGEILNKGNKAFGHKQVDIFKQCSSNLLLVLMQELNKWIKIQELSLGKEPWVKLKRETYTNICGKDNTLSFPKRLNWIIPSSELRFQESETKKKTHLKIGVGAPTIIPHIVIGL